MTQLESSCSHSQQDIKHVHSRCFDISSTLKKQQRKADITHSRIQSLSIGNAPYLLYNHPQPPPLHPFFLAPFPFPSTLNCNYQMQQLYQPQPYSPMLPLIQFPNYPQTPTAPVSKREECSPTLRKHFPMALHRQPTDDRRQQTPVKNPTSKYTVTSKVLGQGSESVVYEGVNNTNGRRVAIKILMSHYTDNQIKIMKRMKECENIIKLHDYWLENGKMLMALELCDGTLEDARKRASLPQRYEFFRQILQGMIHLDRHGIIHRDIKLHNILVKDSQVKLSDFGFAKHIGAKLMVESRQCGTPATMAPEVYFAQSKDKVMYDRKSDIWPLGVVLHELVYNCHPFNYDAEMMEKGNRVKVKNAVGEIQKMLDRMLLTNAHSRMSLDQLVRVYNKFMRGSTSMVTAQDDRVQSRHPLVGLPRFRNPFQKQPSQIPSLPHLTQHKYNNYQTIQTQCSPTPTPTHPNPKSVSSQKRQSVSVVLVVQFWVFIFICVYFLQLLLG